MKLYHIQPEQWFKQWYLKENALYADWSHVDELWVDPYRWLCTQMREQHIAGHPSKDVPPIWAWYQWNGAKAPRPDLRSSMMRQWGQQGRQVMLELEVPEEFVMLSDYDSWHFPLNYWFLSEDEEESARFEQRCNQQSLSYYRNKPLPDKTLHEELVQSWQRIFDYDHDSVVQATLWTLRPEWICSIKYFGKDALAVPPPV